MTLAATHVQDTHLLPLDNFNANLNLVDGVFKLEPVVFGVADGSVSSKVVVNARAPRLAIGIDSTFRKLHLARLLPGTAKLEPPRRWMRLNLNPAPATRSPPCWAVPAASTSRRRPGRQPAAEYAGTDIAEIVVLIGDSGCSCAAPSPPSRSMTASPPAGYSVDPATPTSAARAFSLRRSR